MPKQAPDGNLHLRFNPQNPHHQRAAEYLAAVRGKYKAALIAAALEEYQQQHPYGPDYQELERIRLASHRGFLPKRPILQNLLQRKSVQQEKPMAEATPAVTSKPPEDSLDHVIDLYQLDDE